MLLVDLGRAILCDGMIYDFHTHTFLSDGVLSPIELIRRAMVQGYRTIAITDHVGLGNQRQILEVLIEECRYASAHWDIVALPGVELTHVPPSLVDQAARQAKELGARIVVCHGETVVEPVEEGTNLAAISSEYVDILAHPGLLTEEEAKLAAQRGVHLEISARRGHSLCNGLVARRAKSAGASLILDSDAHEPQDLLTTSLARSIALGSGLTEEESTTLLQQNPKKLLRKLGVEIP